jgi:transcriptional regulator with XRE-family HTH domain
MPRSPRPLSADGEKNLVGHNVKAARTRLGITLEDVCGRVSQVTDGRWIPISQDIYKIEAKRRSVTDIEAAALAEALRIDISGLIVVQLQTYENT